MKYYSEKLNKIYNSVTELEVAEQKFMEEKQESENLKQRVKKHISNIVEECNALINLSDKVDNILSDEDAIEILDEFMKIIPLWSKL